MIGIKPVCLVVIDGWGVSESVDVKGDAIRNAKTPNMDYLQANYSSTQLSALGLQVGLPDGLMGNSEVGHLNIGAGRIVYQDIVRIDQAIQNNLLGKSEALVDAFNVAKCGTGKLHLLGLVSDGGVHSHIDHLFYLLTEAKKFGVPQCFVHFFADGRDTSPKSAVKYLNMLEKFMVELNYGSIASVMGRYYAMDRDKRVERTDLAFDCLTNFNESLFVEDLSAEMRKRYENGETDEFFKPMIKDANGLIEERDQLIFFNYRSDRMRQLTQKCINAGKYGVLTMTKYSGEFDCPVISSPISMENVLSEWLSKQGLKQIHVAETEKYAHVTFFFNGGREESFVNENRELIQSPKVATYDLEPEMSVLAVADSVAKAVQSKTYDFVMCNLAPPDMVGHTGKYLETIKAVEATDLAIGRIFDACASLGVVLFITADHGNAEKMLDEQGGPCTSHTTSRVPFICTDQNLKFKSRGSLCDVAPSILAVMGIKAPEEMSGRNLFE